FPDVGGTGRRTPRAGQIGRYLGLTGVRLGPADALYCGFATHFVTQDRIADLVTAFAQIALRTGDEHRQLKGLLGDFADDAGPAPLVARPEAIHRCFA